MSSRDWLFRVKDILTAIDKIQRYTEKTTMRQFLHNELVVDAVIRNFEIIGEAGKNIPKSVRNSHSEIPWTQMCGMRDILIHEYFGIDVKILWEAAKRLSLN